MKSKSNIQKRICPDHNNQQIDYACYNKNCKSNRLVCKNCINLHTAHPNDFIKDDQIEEIVELSQLQCKQIIKQLNDQFDQMTLQFKKLITSIETKFDIKIERMNEMNNDQFNEYLSSLLNQDYQFTSLTKLFSEGCQNFQDKIIECQKDLGIQELNYIEITKEEMEQAEIYFQQGGEYFQTEHFASAIKYFDLAIDINRNHIKSLCSKGAALMMLGQYQESIECLNKVHQLDSEFENVQYIKIGSLMFMGQYNEVIEYSDKLLQSCPQNIDALLYKGHSLRMLNQFNQSIESFDKILQINPKNIDALSGKAASLRMLGQYEESKKWYNKALLINPNYVNKQWSEGETLRVQKQYPLAILIFDLILQLENDFEKALVSKCKCLIELNKLDEAQIFFNKVLQQNPNNESLKDLLKKLQDKRKQ